MQSSRHACVHVLQPCMCTLQRLMLRWTGPPAAAGVPEDERYEGDDLEVLARAEEAEEAAPGEEEVRRAASWVVGVTRRRARPGGGAVACRHVYATGCRTPLCTASFSLVVSGTASAQHQLSCGAVVCCVVQDGEPLSLIDEVIRGRKRKKKASDEQIDADVHNLVQQASGLHAGCRLCGALLQQAFVCGLRPCSGCEPASTLVGTDVVGMLRSLLPATQGPWLSALLARAHR